MGRLIDADHLLFLLNSAIELRKKIHRNTSDLDMIVEAVNNEPTAYDLNRVVEQLEKNFNDTTQFCISHRENCGLFSHCDQCAFDSALYIVKGGGVDG